MAKPVKSPFDRDGGRRFTELEIPDRKLTKEQKKIADKLTCELPVNFTPK